MANNRLGSAVLRGVLWGMVGAVYAGLFTALWQVFAYQELEIYGFFFAATLAGVAGAAVYGSMQVAIIGTITGIIASTAYMIVMAKKMGLWEVALVSAIAGALLGAVLKLPSHFTRGVPSKAVAGLGAGALAALIVMALLGMFGDLSDIGTVAGLLVVATGMIYVGTVKWWEKKLEPNIPGFVLNSLVSAVVAGIVGGSVWILGGPVVGVVGSSHKELLDMVSNLAPPAMLGGAIAGAISGALLELLGFKPNL